MLPYRLLVQCPELNPNLPQEPLLNKPSPFYKLESCNWNCANSHSEPNKGKHNTI